MNYELMNVNNDPKCKKFGRLDFAKLWNFMVIEGRARVPLRSYLSHTDGQTNKLCVELLP